MAKEYDVNLWQLSPEKKILKSFGKGDNFGKRTPVLKSNADTMLLFNGFWNSVDIEKSKLKLKVIGKNEELISYYSPDLKFYVSVSIDRGKPSAIKLTDTTTNRSIDSVKVNGIARDVVWGRDSKGFGVVFSKQTKYGEYAYKGDILVMFSLK